MFVGRRDDRRRSEGSALTAAAFGCAGGGIEGRLAVEEMAVGPL